MKLMKQTINRILIGVLFLFGVLLIPAGIVKAADSLRDDYHGIQINTSVTPADTLPDGYTTNEKMLITVNIQDTRNYCEMDPIPNDNIYWSVKVGNATAINYTSIISTCGGRDFVIIYPLAPPIAGNYDVVFDFGNSVIITTPFTVIDPPVTPVTTPTVTLDAYYSIQNYPVLLDKDANNTTFEGIAPLTPIFLRWKATGFNNTNIVCTVNGKPQTKGLSYGDYYLTTGPSITTKYSASCTDE